MGSDTLQTDGLDYSQPCEDLRVYVWMSHGWGYWPVGILLVPLVPPLTQ
jgi:hypothetical protein